MDDSVDDWHAENQSRHRHMARGAGPKKQKGGGGGSQGTSLNVRHCVLKERLARKA